MASKRNELRSVSSSGESIVGPLAIPLVLLLAATYMGCPNETVAVRLRNRRGPAGAERVGELSAERAVRRMERDAGSGGVVDEGMWMSEMGNE